MLRRRTLEGRFFAWMLVMALVPALGLVALGTWVWSDSLDRMSTLGPWDRVGESGREVFDAAAGAAASDSVLAAALERHHDELSESLLLARRWAYLRERAVGLLPTAALVFGLFLVGAAFWAARRLARQLARPINELVHWAELLAREEPLPDPRGREAGEVREVRSLRSAFRAAEEELGEARRRALEAQRVGIWGEMARRVAHEMKNPLTPLRLALHRLGRSTVQDSDLSEAMVVIGEEVDRLEELAHQFAELGRPPEGPTSQVDLGELVGSLLETDLAAPVDAELEISSSVPLIEGHYEALVRAFRNLIRNAAEAMEGHDGPRRVDLSIGGEPGWVEVRIGDRGPGVPAGAESRIFEPDFTTKSRGTGLGLALVKQTVIAHGGTITLSARSGGGAEFLVRLPVEGAGGGGAGDGTAKNLRPLSSSIGASPEVGGRSISQSRGMIS